MTGVQTCALPISAVILIAKDRPDAAVQAWRAIALSEKAEPELRARAARNVCHIAQHRLNRTRLIQSLAAEATDAAVRATCIESLADGAMMEGLTARALRLYADALATTDAANGSNALLAAKYAQALIESGRSLEATLFLAARLDADGLNADERAALTLCQADALAANGERAAARALYVDIISGGGRLADRAMDALIRLNATGDAGR